MADVYRLVMTGTVTDVAFEHACVDHETGELLYARPVHTVKVAGPDGFGAEMRVRMTDDRRLAWLPVGRPVRVTLEMEADRG